VLIAAHSELMWEEFQTLLDGDRNDGELAGNTQLLKSFR
jgi:hypothetical protein